MSPWCGPRRTTPAPTCGCTAKANEGPGSRKSRARAFRSDQADGGRYFPRMGARSRLRDSGTRERSVAKACWRGAAAGTRPLLRERPGQDPDGLLGQGHVGRQTPDHHLRGHRLLSLPPHVVIGHVGHGRVADLRLPGQLGLRHRGHADDVRPPLAPHPALRLRGEPRPLDGDERPALMHGAPHCLHGLIDVFAQVGAEGVGHRDVDHQAVAEEGVGALALGGVDELIGHHDVAGGELLAQAPAGADGDDPLHPEGFQGIDVGAAVDLAGGDPMTAPMAGEESHPPPLQRPDDDGVAGIPEGRRDPHLLHVPQGFHLIEAAAPDDGQLHRLPRHGSSLCAG
jgi:hypothetical protein